MKDCMDCAEHGRTGNPRFGVPHVQVCRKWARSEEGRILYETQEHQRSPEGECGPEASAFRPVLDPTRL